MDAVELKQVGSEIVSAIAAFGVKYKSRSELRSIVVMRLNMLRGHNDAAKRLIGDHVMSLFGYGGGLH